MSTTSTTKPRPKANKTSVSAGAGETDWAALDAMTDEEIHAAALSDPDAQPWTEEQWAAAKPIPRTITLRRAFRLTQEQFAEHFAIPIGTLRDWEQRRKEPDAAARAYLRVIAAEPDAVRRALGTGGGKA